MAGPNSFSAPQLAALRFRIIYDTLSKFSCAVNKCNSIADVFRQLTTDIKYLFDFVAVKFYARDGDFSETFLVSRNAAVHDSLHGRLAGIVHDYEREAAETQMVQSLERGSGLREALGVGLSPDINAMVESIWVFPFRIKDATLVVSILSGPQYAFKRTDIPVLKIVCESFFSKILSLRLLDEVVESKTSLDKAYVLLDAKREKIEQLTQWQEQIIQERTAELKDKNGKLIELIQFNAHNIREPLCRILGLADLIRLFPPEEVKDELLPALLISCTDLDEAIMSTIAYIEKEKTPSANEHPENHGGGR